MPHCRGMRELRQRLRITLPLYGGSLVWEVSAACGSPANQDALSAPSLEAAKAQPLYWGACLLRTLNDY